MDRLTLHFPTDSGTTAQIVRVIDVDEESGDVKVEVVGRADGKSRAIGSTKWMKGVSLRTNYRPHEYLPADQITGRVDLSTGIRLDDTDWYPVPVEPERFDAPAQITADATTNPDLFALLEEQTERINQIGTVNTDVLKELWQIRGLMAKMVRLLEDAVCEDDEEDQPWQRTGLSLDDLAGEAPPPPRSTEELTSGASYLNAAN